VTRGKKKSIQEQTGKKASPVILGDIKKVHPRAQRLQGRKSTHWEASNLDTARTVSHQRQNATVLQYEGQDHSLPCKKGEHVHI